LEVGLWRILITVYVLLFRRAQELGFNTLKSFSSHTVAIQYQHTPKKPQKNNENTKTTPKIKSPRNQRHTGEGIQVKWSPGRDLNAIQMIKHQEIT
jgi:hypothetical protein